MITYKNILITADDSHEAEWAFNRAVGVAKRDDAKLTIANVIDSRMYSSCEVYDTQFTEKSRHFVEELLDGYKEVATNAGVKDVETHLELGSPKSIVPKKLAHGINADLIMSGTSGLNAVERPIVGSVLESIVRYAPHNVLIVHTEELPADFQPQVATTQLREKYQNQIQMIIR